MENLTGKQAIFNYPKEFTTLPEYSKRRGKTVTIIRQLTDEECDPCQQPMYEIQANDGWIGHAWCDELEIK